MMITATLLYVLYTWNKNKRMKFEFEECHSSFMLISLLNTNFIIVIIIFSILFHFFVGSNHTLLKNKRRYRFYEKEKLFQWKHLIDKIVTFYNLKRRNKIIFSRSLSFDWVCFCLCRQK
jgi:hypothetical protein